MDGEQNGTQAQQQDTQQQEPQQSCMLANRQTQQQLQHIRKMLGPR